MNAMPGWPRGRRQTWATLGRPLPCPNSKTQRTPCNLGRQHKPGPLSQRNAPYLANVGENPDRILVVRYHPKFACAVFCAQLQWRMQPHMPYLALLSNLAPNAASLWMLPLGVLMAAIVHVAVTRRLEMMIAAAGVLAFYFGVPLALDKVQGTTAAQQALLVTLYNAFSCIACQMLIGLALLGAVLHGVKMWRGREQEGESNTVMPMPPKKDAPTLNMLTGKNLRLEGGRVKGK